MFDVVTRSERHVAEENAKYITRHFLMRMSEAIRKAMAEVSVGTPDAAIVEMNKLSNLAGKAQQAASSWKGLWMDWQQHEPKQLNGLIGSLDKCAEKGPGQPTQESTGYETRTYAVPHMTPKYRQEEIERLQKQLAELQSR